MNLADLNRLRKILIIISLSGGGVLVDRLRLKYFVPLQCRIHCFLKKQSPEECLVRMVGTAPVISPQVLRTVLEKLGPTFIKLGQVLSLRADLVGEEISGELSKLQSNAPPFPYFDPRQVIKTIQTDLLDAVGFLKTLPERVQNVLTKLEKGEIGIKLDTEDLQGIKREFDRQNDVRILGIVVTAVFFATFGLFYLEGKKTLLGFSLSTLGLMLFAFLFFWFLLKLRQGPIK